MFPLHLFWLLFMNLLLKIGIPKVGSTMSNPAQPEVAPHSKRDCSGFGGGGYPAGRAGAPGIGAEA